MLSLIFTIDDCFKFVQMLFFGAMIRFGQLFQSFNDKQRLFLLDIQIDTLSEGLKVHLVEL